MCEETCWDSVKDMKSFDQSQDDAQIRNKWKMRQPAIPGLPQLSRVYLENGCLKGTRVAIHLENLEKSENVILGKSPGNCGLIVTCCCSSDITK